jgi:hypothetical protein
MEDHVTGKSNGKAVLSSVILGLAEAESIKEGINFVGVDQLFLALVGDRESLTYRILIDTSVNPDSVILKLGIGSGTSSVSRNRPVHTPRLKKVLSLAEKKRENLDTQNVCVYTFFWLFFLSVRIGYFKLSSHYILISIAL